MELSRSDFLLLQPVLDTISKSIENSRSRSLSNVYWLSVDFRSLLVSTGLSFRISRPLALELLMSVLEQTNGGSVIVSAFHFDFPRLLKFVVETEPIQTGAFGRLLLSQRPSNRTSHPFYSMFVFGEAERELLDLPIDDSKLCKSTGLDSMFAWLTNQKTELITVGHHYVKSLSAVHHAEHLVGVPFRYTKKFQGVISRGGIERNINCEFYVRDLDICDFSSLTERGDSAFRKRKLVHTLAVDVIPKPLLIQNINLHNANQLMVDDLLKGEKSYTDYIGPLKPNFDVITSTRADELYLNELNSLST